MEAVDQKISLILILLNCGMARVLLYFMERKKVQMTDGAIFNDTR
jgi:hypothetical protein